MFFKDKLPDEYLTRISENLTNFYNKNLLPYVTLSQTKEDDGKLFYDFINQDGIKIDLINNYYLNNHLYRGDDFSYNPDVLVAGCSFTFGVGVPDEGTWPNILKNISNVKTISNVGVNGFSVQSICKTVIKYCNIFGKPKNIFCLMPNFTRLLFISDENYHLHNLRNHNTPSALDIGNVVLNDLNKADKYIKTPFNLDSSISPHQAIMESMMAVFFLESYCKSNNINLVWTTWHGESHFVLENIKNCLDLDFELDNYFPFKDIANNYKNIGWPDLEFEPMENYLINTVCDKDHKSSLINHPSWKEGSDLYIKNGKKAATNHPGIHFQYHVAEFFSQYVLGEQ